MNFEEELKDQKYSKAYSESKLFLRIKKFSKNAGIKAVYLCLLLFYTLQKSTTPKWAKSIIVGALGYFILPLDFIPDFLPITGFSDDVTALISVLVAVALYVDEETKIKAKEKLHVWFGAYDEAKLYTIESKLDKEDS